MGASCFRDQSTDESVFNVIRKITNTMRDLEIKENRLTNDKMPKKRAMIMSLKREQRLQQARMAFGTYKKYQTTRDQYWTLRENLERIKHEIDTAHTNVVATEGFKQANTVMERMLTTTSLADVDAILDKCREHMEQGDEIFSALASPLDETMDMDAIDQEMEELIETGNPEPEEVDLPEVPVEERAIAISQSSRKVSRKHSRKASGTLKEPLLTTEAK